MYNPFKAIAVILTLKLNKTTAYNHYKFNAVPNITVHFITLRNTGGVFLAFTNVKSEPPFYLL